MACCVVWCDSRGGRARTAARWGWGLFSDRAESGDRSPLLLGADVRGPGHRRMPVPEVRGPAVAVPASDEPVGDRSPGSVPVPGPRPRSRFPRVGPRFPVPGLHPDADAGPRPGDVGPRRTPLSTAVGCVTCCFPGTGPRDRWVRWGPVPGPQVRSPSRVSVPDGLSLRWSPDSPRTLGTGPRSPCSVPALGPGPRSRSRSPCSVPVPVLGPRIRSSAPAFGPGTTPVPG